MATTVNQTYSTPHSKNAWAHLASAAAWRKVKPLTTDGVTNTFLLLALAKAHGASVTVTEDASNEIVAVYL